MKIKRFKNLWTMGLIIFGVILVTLYLLKLIVPNFIISIAELPSIIKFGEYVDTHIWAYYLFNGLTSFFILYFYCCACCRIKHLNYKECLIIVASIILSYIVEAYIPSLLLAYNFMAYIFLPLIIVSLRKLTNINIFYSLCFCFLITTTAQWLSLEIRGISTLISYPNTATYFILLIDLYIWNVLLYCFYNYKNKKEK